MNSVPSLPFALQTWTAVSPFFTWLLRTRMSFYGHDLQLPWWFGLNCWNFAWAGLVMLWTEPHWVSQPQLWFDCRFPYRSLAVLLIFVQAPLSFLADYVHMEHDSYWHAVDRFVALPLMTCEVLKYALQCRQTYKSWKRNDINAAMHPLLCALYGMAIVFAFFCFTQSTVAQQSLHRDRFVYWHNAWHLYPLIASAATLVDFYGCQGWKRSTRQYTYQMGLHVLKKAD